MSVLVGVTLLMALLGAGLGIVRARRMVDGESPLRVFAARGMSRATGSLGVLVLAAGGLGVQLVEHRSPPLARADMLSLAVPAGLLLASVVAAWLARAKQLKSGGLFALLGAPLIVYTLIAGANGALDLTAPVTQRVSVLDKRQLPQKNNGIAYSLVVQTADIAASPLWLRVDAATWLAIPVGRDSALLTTRAGGLGVRWVDPARFMQPAPSIP